MITRWMVTATAGVLVVGSAAAQEPKPVNRQVPRRLLPYMVVAVPPVPVTSPRTTTIGGYTRLRMSFTPNAAGDEAVREYDRERRPGILRWLMGKAISRVFSVKAIIAQPQITTVTLAASIGRDSNHKVGETWSTDINSERLMTPYFRIDPDSSVALESSFTLSSTYDASVTRALLDTVRRGARLVAPSAALVTSLNEGRFDDASNFVDTSLANLLKESIAERTMNDFALSTWGGKQLLRIKLVVPVGNEITPNFKATDRKSEAPYYLGEWVVESTPPVLSVFADVPWENAPPSSGSCSADKTLGCVAFAALDAPTVLNLNVAENVTIGDTLAGDEAVGVARDKLTKLPAAAATDTRAAAAQTLCALVADRAQRLGFNRYDVAAITWAYAKRANLDDKATDMLRPANCPALEPGYRAGLPDKPAA